MVVLYERVDTQESTGKRRRWFQFFQGKDNKVTHNLEISESYMLLYIEQEFVSLSLIVHELLQRLSSQPLLEFASELGVEHNLTTLTKNLFTVREFINSKQSFQNLEYKKLSALHGWLMTYRVALDDINDILEEMATICSDPSWYITEYLRYNVLRLTSNISTHSLGVGGKKITKYGTIVEEYIIAAAHRRNSTSLFIRNSPVYIRWALVKLLPLRFPLLSRSSTFLWRYLSLPAPLKRCFAYVVFLDNIIDKEKLISLWMAEGFLHQSNGNISNRRMEDIGADYLQELVNISFIKQYKHDCQGKWLLPSDDNTNKSVYAISSRHVIQFAKSILGLKYFKIRGKSQPNISEYARHSSLDCKNATSALFRKFYDSKCLHTFMILADPSLKHVMYSQFLPNLFLKLTHLRVLDLSNTNLCELPESIGNLRHLRFLDLSYSCIEALPKSLSTLYQLQTLKIRGCMNLLQLPEDMENLQNLRHFDIGIGDLYIDIPPGIGKITGLQNLSTFCVGNNGKIGVLKNLVNLRGQLVITGLDKLLNAEEAKEARLYNKPYFYRLVLVWNSLHKDTEAAKDMLTGFQPHANVRELKIKRYGGVKFPLWFGNPSFSNLECISLSDCNRCESLPPLGQLPRLKTLRIYIMDRVQDIDHLFYGDRISGICSSKSKSFPSLEILILNDLKSLKTWVGIEKDTMPRLRELVISSCPLLVALPPLQFFNSLRYLEVSHCNKLQSFPRGRIPRSVRSLEIFSCPLLIALPRLHVISLLRLMEISDCPKIQSLPRGTLPPLCKLRIYRCPTLAQSCREGGKDWPKIRLTPEVYNL